MADDVQEIYRSSDSSADGEEDDEIAVEEISKPSKNPHNLSVGEIKTMLAKNELKVGEKVKAKSLAWSSFYDVTLPDGKSIDHAQCKKCLQIIRTMNGTSGLLRHACSKVPSAVNNTIPLTQFTKMKNSGGVSAENKRSKFFQRDPLGWDGKHPSTGPNGTGLKVGKRDGNGNGTGQTAAKSGTGWGEKKFPCRARPQMMLITTWSKIRALKDRYH